MNNPLHELLNIKPQEGWSIVSARHKTTLKVLCVFELRPSSPGFTETIYPLMGAGLAPPLYSPFVVPLGADLLDVERLFSRRFLNGEDTSCFDFSSEAPSSHDIPRAVRIYDAQNSSQACLDGFYKLKQKRYVRPKVPHMRMP